MPHSQGLFIRDYNVSQPMSQTQSCFGGNSLRELCPSGPLLHNSKDLHKTNYTWLHVLTTEIQETFKISSSTWPTYHPSLTLDGKTIAAHHKITSQYSSVLQHLTKDTVPVHLNCQPAFIKRLLENWLSHEVTLHTCASLSDVHGPRWTAQAEEVPEGVTPDL